MTRLLSSLLAFARVSVDRRVERCRRAMRRHEGRLRKRRRELDAIGRRLSATADRVAADIADWRAEKRAAEEAIEMLERKLGVMELVNETLVVEHGKLVQMHKAETAVHVMRQVAATPREE